jgi:hypothetical protein
MAIAAPHNQDYASCQAYTLHSYKTHFTQCTSEQLRSPEVDFLESLRP